MARKGGIALSTWPLILKEPGLGFFTWSLRAARDCDWRLHASL